MTDRLEDQTRIDIGNAIRKLHESSYGLGMDSVEVYGGDDAVFVVMDGLELQESEHFLISSGDANAVIEQRGRFQRAIESTFRAAVERSTGRRVISFASVTSVDPPYAIEIFRLGVPTDE